MQRSNYPIATEKPGIPLEDVLPLLREAKFASGRSVELDHGSADRLTVRNPDGAIELAIRFTPQGPVLNFASSQIQLESAGAVDVNCERFRVRARQGIELQTTGEARLEAGNVKIEALTGATQVKSHDDTQILGEQILLNCDRPEPLPAWASQLAEKSSSERTLPVARVSGDAALAAELTEGQRS